MWSDTVVDHELFESREMERLTSTREKWELKHRAKTLPVLSPGDRVWVKSPSDKGEEGFVVRLDSNPESYWVSIGSREIRRNRKHLFLLAMPKEEGCKPSESPALERGVGESIECGVTPFNPSSLSDTPGLVSNDIFSNIPIEIQAEGVVDLDPEEEESREADPNEGTSVDPGVLIDREVDENPFQYDLFVSGGDGSPEVVKTRSGRTVKSTCRQDCLYY